MIKRKILADLKEWQKSPYRKPLILCGARQVGKTYVLQHFGAEYYKDVAYFNFDQDSKLGQLFAETKSPQRIIEQLSIVHRKQISPKDTLLIFDEIQECPDALNALKYFREEAPEYHVACAGSLLGVYLSRTSFPVGQVDLLDMYPLSFSEFLLANGHKNLVELMRNITKPEKIPDIFTDQLTSLLKLYFIVGGMPEAVKRWADTHDLTKVDKVLSTILRTYEMDFAKHVSDREANKISTIWKSIPSQLAKENKKFLYKVAKPGARAREYEDALNWLDRAHLITKVYDVTEPALPIDSYRDVSAFKIYLGDVGLLRYMSKLDPAIIIDGNKLFTEFKGALTENYIANILMRKTQTRPSYFTFGNYEIDFLIQQQNTLIPIEAKSGTTKNHTSLTKYIEKYQPDYAICFSMDNLAKSGKILNIPLYFAEYFGQVEV